MSAAGNSFHINVSDRTPEEAVQLLLEFAAHLQVSDLFFLTSEDEVEIAVRHLGILRQVTELNADLGRRCMTHIKAMAGMNIAEHRKILDGRWILQLNGDHTDLRISTIPSLFGEDFTVRLLRREQTLVSLENLGLWRRELNHLLELLNSPSGLILVTGPTGSGKTTTLYACLKHLNNGQRKINTIEDPIEYTLKGVRQSQVHARLELDFPELLRGVLRQAPDVIMIGEIRDAATAETAVRAANSGHLVLATLHAPIAAGAIQSMLSFGVPPHFLAGSLRGVVAQRLLRTLCERCRVSFDHALGPNTFEDVEPWLEPEQGKTLYAAKGCPECRATGYRSRTGVFEVLPISNEMRRLILEKQPTAMLRAQAAQEGVLEIRQAAMLCVARGQTTIEEVLRAIPPEFLGLDV